MDESTQVETPEAIAAGIRLNSARNWNIAQRAIARAIHAERDRHAARLRHIQQAMAATYRDLSAAVTMDDGLADAAQQAMAKLSTIHTLLQGQYEEAANER